MKHAFGFPLHQASIDEDFNIVRSHPSQEGSSSTPRLDIDRQGRILKDGIEQRVYLIGLQYPLQEASLQASSSDAQPKPKPAALLLAIQSTETSYPKFAAGTPLPTGGVVDVEAALYTTHDQPNLYKATLAIETLQETHHKKEVDLPTLKLFETEQVKHSNAKTSLRGITTFTGEVKDKPLQDLPENYKQKKAYQETTGPCLVYLDKLLSDVKQELETTRIFLTRSHVIESIERQIAHQVLGEKQVPTPSQGWKRLVQDAGLTSAIQPV